METNYIIVGVNDIDDVRVDLEDGIEESEEI